MAHLTSSYILLYILILIYIYAYISWIIVQNKLLVILSNLNECLFHKPRGHIGVYNLNISIIILIKNMDHILEEMFHLKS